jgi:hypothetical protein
MALIGLLAIAVVVLLFVAAVLFSVYWKWTMSVLVNPGVASRFRVAAARKH